MGGQLGPLSLCCFFHIPSGAPPTHQRSPPPRVLPGSSQGRPFPGATRPWCPLAQGAWSLLAVPSPWGSTGSGKPSEAWDWGACSVLDSAALIQPSRWPEHGGPAPRC